MMKNNTPVGGAAELAELGHVVSDDGGDRCKIPEAEQTFQSVLVRL